MKKQIIFVLLALLLLAGCSGADTPGGYEQLRILTEDYPPYNFTDKNGEVTGQSTEIVQLIMQDVGVESAIELIPLSEAIELAQKGPGVALYSLNRTAEREELFKWVGPVGFYEQIFYARKDSGAVLNSLEDVKEVDKIAVYTGDAGAAYLADQGFKNLVESPTDSEALQKLAAGEVDLWLGNRAGFLITANQAGVDPDLLIEIPAVIIHANLYIAFSKDVPDEVVLAWQQALDRLKSERDHDDKTLIEKIETKYGDPAYIESLIN